MFHTSNELSRIFPLVSESSFSLCICFQIHRNDDSGADAVTLIARRRLKHFYAVVRMMIAEQKESETRKLRE